MPDVEPNSILKRTRRPNILIHKQQNKPSVGSESLSILDATWVWNRTGFSSSDSFTRGIKFVLPDRRQEINESGREVTILNENVSIYT